MHKHLHTLTKQSPQTLQKRLFTTTRTTSISNSNSKMSDQNKGILGQAADSAKNAANYVSDTVQGKSAEASKEGNKEQAKGNVPGQDSLSDRASGAAGAISDKLKQEKHEGSAEANKRSI